MSKKLVLALLSAILVLSTLSQAGAVPASEPGGAEATFDGFLEGHLSYPAKQQAAEHLAR